METGPAPSGGGDVNNSYGYAVSNDVPVAVIEMPTVYNEPQVTPTTTTPDQTARVAIDYLTGLDAIMKYVELMLSLATFICSIVYYTPFTEQGGGWVQFVAITAFMLTAVLLLLHLFGMTLGAIPIKFTECCFYSFYTLSFFIAGVVAACLAWMNGAVIATTIFAFFCLVAFAIDAVLHFLEWRTSSEGPYFSSMMSSSSNT